MYLDTDVVLAELKADDWLASAVDVSEIPHPATSVATCIEINYVLENDWDRERLTDLPALIVESGIGLLPLDRTHLEAGGELQRTYDRLNYFDAIHLGTATVREEAVVSTDTLYPDVTAVENVDPRDL